MIAMLLDGPDCLACLHLDYDQLLVQALLQCCLALKRLFALMLATRYLHNAPASTKCQLITDQYQPPPPL